jgi:hypothetical protein
MDEDEAMDVGEERDASDADVDDSDGGGGYEDSGDDSDGNVFFSSNFLFLLC